MQCPIALTITRVVSIAGYYDVSVEGVWRWLDCQPTADWQKPLWPGEEPMVGTGDCGYLVGVQGDGEAEIRPAVCDDRKYFICEVVDNSKRNPHKLN